MRSAEDRARRRRQVDELLQRIDVQRRRQLLLEAAGAQAPALELEAAQTRQQLAELIQ
ncbi:MAG TPA: hypothetical protein VJP41_04140 [Gaiellaceae bacterium]|nr:hypothetical protein [Gaiellaceae bacterium]